MEDKLFKEIVTHLQVQGYVYPGSQIYGGLANAWDYGPLGVLIKNNVKSLWWQKFVTEQCNAELQTLISEENLKPEPAKKFVENSFRDGVLKTIGTDIDKILPPISRFSGGENRKKKKQNVIEKLKVFFEKYFDIINPSKF